MKQLKKHNTFTTSLLVLFFATSTGVVIEAQMFSSLLSKAQDKLKDTSDYSEIQKELLQIKEAIESKDYEEDEISNADLQQFLKLIDSYTTIIENNPNPEDLKKDHANLKNFLEEQARLGSAFSSVAEQALFYYKTTEEKEQLWENNIQDINVRQEKIKALINYQQKRLTDVKQGLEQLEIAIKSATGQVSTITQQQMVNINKATTFLKNFDFPATKLPNKYANKINKLTKFIESLLRQYPDFLHQRDVVVELAKTISEAIKKQKSIKFTGKSLEKLLDTIVMLENTQQFFMRLESHSVDIKIINDIKAAYAKYKGPVKFSELSVAEQERMVASANLEKDFSALYLQLKNVSERLNKVRPMKPSAYENNIYELINLVQTLQNNKALLNRFKQSALMPKKSTRDEKKEKEATGNAVHELMSAIAFLFGKEFFFYRKKYDATLRQLLEISNKIGLREIGTGSEYLNEVDEAYNKLNII
jgi:hypothetical protein